MAPVVADLMTLCRAAAAHFSRAEADLDAQQAVRGLDAMDELALHPLVAEALETVGCGVLREIPYPGGPSPGPRPPRRPRRSERERCDLVLTPEPGQPLADPVAALVEQDRAAETLFAHLAAEPAPAAPAPPGAPAPAAPEDALWLEVKTLGQYCFHDGTPGPNPSYAGELVGGPARDIAKLARDPAITTAAAMIVLFCESETVARHDIAQAVMRWLDRDLPIAEPIIDGLPIQDRIGNTWCAIAMARVRRGD